MDRLPQLETHRSALRGHCYRMLGSAADADDAVQETMVRAWRNLDRFEERAALRSWLYRIATNVCLDALKQKNHRHRPMEGKKSGSIDDELTTQPRTHWLEPIPDAQAIPDDLDPSEQVVLRQSIRLAFVAALQHLPAKQRAALLMADVLGLSASEIATTLETTVSAVNSALQRARATMQERQAHPSSSELPSVQADLLARYVEAFERYDVDALTSLMHEDAILSMPPYELWLQGTTAIAKWLAGRGAGCRGSKIVAAQANGLPSFAQYRRKENGEGYFAWALVVLEVAGDRILATNSFLDVDALFPRFGLPLEIQS